MTKTAEELKREMYEFLKILRVNSGRPNLADIFESALEAYLEALRKQLNQMAAGSSELLTAIKTIDQHHRSMTEERDNLRNRLQAFEFANKSAGEFLIEAQELLRSEREVIAHLQAKVKRQRQSIGQLKNDRNNAQSLAASHYAKYQKVRQEMAELRKSMMPTKVPKGWDVALKEPAMVGFYSAMFSKSWDESVVITIERHSRTGKERAFMHRINGAKKKASVEVVRSKMGETK